MKGGKSRKSQMEILGLAIVVILVTLGVLFAITVMRKPATEIEKEFKEKTVATSYLDAVLGTNTPCHKATFRELIQDCAQFAQIKCDALNSCDYAREKFGEIFDQTFKVRKTNYHLAVEGPGESSSISINPACPGELTPGIQYIATRTGTVTIRLEICS